MAAEPPAPPDELAAEAARVRDEATGLDDRRRAKYLATQLDGMACTAERLAGRAVTYAEEALRCYGVEVRPVPEERFEDAHREIDRLLPGNGDVRERYQAWSKGIEIPGDALMASLTRVQVELRRRTESLYGLPEGESADLELVTSEPWSGFNYYLGGLKSRIAVNADFPTPADFVATLLSHEIYPGHHTEHSWKESRLVRGKGYLEESISMIATPQCLVTEGIATNALDALGSEAEPACEAILRRDGFGYDVELTCAIRAARRCLASVVDNAGWMLYEQGADLDAVRAYCRRWSLEPEARLERSLKFLTHPVWRTYGIVYEAGRRTVERWMAGDPARFKRLLTEQLTPSDLLAA